MVDRLHISVGEIPRRSNSIFTVLVGTGVIILIIFGCLISAIVLFHQYQKSERKFGFEVISDSHHCLDLKNITMTKAWETDHRLPTGIVPINYDLLLNPDLEGGRFQGKVVIAINVEKPTPYLAVHIKNLKVSNTVLTNGNQLNVSFKNAFHSEKNNFWVVEFGESAQLETGKYSLSLDFQGELTGKIVGFYRSSYLDVIKNVRRNIATSKFEPVDARQAFPCFDEPALKAKFKVRLVRPDGDGYSALSNMNVEKEEAGPEANQVTVHFAETVPMSTYLACFIVSDFNDSGAVIVNNQGKPIPVKVYSTPAQVSSTLFAKTAAAQVTSYYVNYFGIPYPLPKLDLIAIPDFVSGAMEHWGLITFRETAILFNDKENSAPSQKRVATVVAHEIAHQWFGNLVTMKWWDDLWLNEGFASFMEAKGVDQGIKECKDWDIQGQYVFQQYQPVMVKDGTLSSHPIVQPVNHPNQINEIFDSISYCKGSAVIRMLEDFMGVSQFQTGIQKYLKANQYSAAATNDLWSSLDEAIAGSGISVSEVMQTWTRQMGYPLINVKRTPSSWVLTQERFLNDPGATFNASESPFGYKWDVPIRYTNPLGEIKMTWLKKKDASVEIPGDLRETYIKLNHLQLGFYRVNYETNIWSEFSNILATNYNSLHRIDRANLIDDAFNIASAGKLDFAVALDLVQYIKAETEYLPWATAFNSLKQISELLSSGVHFPNMRKFLLSLVENLYGTATNQLSWSIGPNDSHLQRLLRVKILEFACYAGLPACLNDVGQIFSTWVKNPATVIHPDVRSLVYRYGMSAVGGDAEWDIVWERYKAETNPQEKESLLEALAKVKESWLISRLLEYAKDESNVRSQDYFSVLRYIATNPIGAPIVWDFYRDEWEYLVNRFTLYHRLLGQSILTVTSSFSTKNKLEEIEAFYSKYPEAGAGVASRKSAKENTKNNINWLQRNEEAIGTWLGKKFPGS